MAQAQDRLRWLLLFASAVVVVESWSLARYFGVVGERTDLSLEQLFVWDPAYNVAVVVPLLIVGWFVYLRLLDRTRGEKASAGLLAWALSPVVVTVLLPVAVLASFDLDWTAWISAGSVVAAALVGSRVTNDPGRA